MILYVRGVLGAVGHYDINASFSILVFFQWVHHAASVNMNASFERIIEVSEDQYTA